MKKASEVVQSPEIGRLQDYVMGILPSLRLSVSSVEVEGGQRVLVIARSEDGSVQETVAVEAQRAGRKAGRHALSEFKRRMAEKRAGDGIFISFGGYSDDAAPYASANRITLHTPESLAKPASSAKNPGGPPEAHNIFDRVFAGSMDYRAAVERFEENRRRPFMGLLGPDERVDLVEGHFAPVGAFSLSKGDGVRPLSGPMRAVRGDNSFHVNLNTCALYFVSRGLTGKDLKLRSTNLLRRMVDLPETAVRILSNVFEQEELVFDRLDPEYKAFLGENANSLAMLQNLGLISMRGDGRAFLSNVSLPRFTEEKYDLEKFIGVRGQLESEFPADPVAYHPKGVLSLLRDFFGAQGEFKGVTYLPYFACRYLGSDGKVRFELIEDVTPKNG
jgi:hypothetical protein